MSHAFWICLVFVPLIIGDYLVSAENILKTEISIVSSDGTQGTFLQFLEKEDFTVLESRNLHSAV